MYFNKYLEPLDWLIREFDVKDKYNFIEKLPDMSIKKEYELIIKKESRLSSNNRKKVIDIFNKRNLKNE
jgi:hypothetical protein